MQTNHCIKVGTVDKFQGQEAAVCFFSMATPSVEEIPRYLEFLFSRNRLNVAISRARCRASLRDEPDSLLGVLGVLAYLVQRIGEQAQRVLCPLEFVWGELLARAERGQSDDTYRSTHGGQRSAVRGDVRIVLAIVLL
jgi:hypothetical protein